MAIDLAKRFEGCRLERYFCPAGIPTIGYGHVCRAEQPPISIVTAESWLLSDLEKAMLAAIRLCPGLDSEGRITALTDFVFNLGSGRLAASTLRRRVNESDWPAAAEEIKKWNKGGGRVLPGLVLRREAEARLIYA